MADQDPSTPNAPTGPSGSAEERMAALQHLEDGEAKKQSQMKWVDGANYGMLGADVGYGAYAAGTAATAAGATGAAAAGAAALAAVPAVVALGGAWLLGKIGVTGAVEKGAEWLGDKLGLSIGKGDPHPACVGDDIAHSSGFWGMVAGLAIGVAIGAAVAATVATGGLAGAVIVGACMAGGLSLGSGLAAASQSLGSNCGKIASGSGNVTFEGKAAARVTDIIACDKHPGPEPLVEGSLTITVNQLPLVRVGHSSHCSGKVNSGRKSILIDKTTGQFGPKNPELTAGEEFFAGLVGGLLGAKLGGMVKGKAPGEPTKSAEREGVKDETATPCKDPIDVATGEMMEIRTDVSIPGVLPLVFTRRYRTRSDDDGMLGPKWSVNWSQRLRWDDGHLVRFFDGGGLSITFEAPDAELNGINLREPRYRLEGTRAAPRILDDEARHILWFAPLVEGVTSRIERIEDWNGNAIDFEYDAHGRLTTLRHTVGHSLVLAYLGGAHTVSSITLHEASGETHRLVDYAYENGMLTQVSSFQSGQFHYTYDAHGWMTSWRDTDKTEVRYAYDSAGRVVETGTREGYHTGRFVYEDGLTRVIDADGEWRYEHNAEGLVTREVNPLGHVTLREWQLGRLASQTDPLEARTEFQYDAYGKLCSVEDPSGAITQFKYDAQRRLAAVVPPSGPGLAFEYDAQHRLIARTEPDGTVKRFRYGPCGEVLRKVEGEQETRFDYDTQLRLVTTRLPSGAKLGTRYDVMGRLVEASDADGNVSRYNYTAGVGNPRGALALATLADGSVWRTTYNSEGLPVEHIDPLGRVTRRAYGPFDLLLTTTDAAGHITRFEYDHATRLTKIVNALGEAWTYHYDAAGRLAEEVDWGGRVTRYERDAAGRLCKRILPDGGAWRYRYDAADRLIAVDAGDVEQVYQYDAAGRLISAAVHGATTYTSRYHYDEKGRLVEEDQQGHRLAYGYDALGRRTERKTPHRTTRYEYDELGLLTQVAGLTIRRDVLGREVEWHAGEFVAQRQYDALGRILHQAAGPRQAFDAMQADPVRALEQLSRQRYHYDAAGQLVQLDTATDALTYQHDARGQVIAVGSIQQPAEHYTYNAAQNIAAHGKQGAVDRHHYFSGGLPERVGPVCYRYDARGRTVEKTIAVPGFRTKTWRYGWDGLNRLVAVRTPDGGAWVYRYDAFNRRVEKINAATGNSVRYVWDGYTIAERWDQRRDGSTGVPTTWHFDPDSYAPLAQEAGGRRYAVFSSPTGLPLEIHDEGGERVWAPRYNLWGKALTEDQAKGDGAPDTSLRFAGQWADPESGLHYNLNRYYDPDSGCYLCIDPISIKGGHRTQGYVNNPLHEVDPLGLAVCQARYDRYKAFRDQGLSVEEAARRSKSSVDGTLPEAPKTISIIGFRGAGSVSDLAAANAPHPYVVTGHVGYSFDGKQIFGFGPKVPEGMSAYDAVQSLRKGESYPGMITDDTAVFQSVAEHPAVSRGGEPQVVIEQKIPVSQEQFDAIKAAHDAIGIDTPMDNVFYGFPGKNASTFNCATFPESIGIPIPEASGNMRLYFPELEKVGQPWEP